MSGDKLFAKICFEGEGVVFEKKFKTEAEASAFVEGFNATLDNLDIEDDSHFACNDDFPAEDLK